ncbi:hypothetical protein CBX96_07440 [Shewanella sp. BC20]|uniref:hypothetical protein n=1 Tax=Shewanella sp. BC20 TaxID=2004459 RepID=UPI000D65345C|nr:hypothetical protein [Shewanella sp. BC20]PWF64018.1 hypothetical protein CBX96_07440 [Shewanella sp. BC20]
MNKKYISALAKSFEEKWFNNKSYEIFNLYNQVIEYLITQYEGENHRAIKGNGSTPKYKFNNRNRNIKTEISTINVTPKTKYIEVRFLPKSTNNITLKKNIKNNNTRLRSKKNRSGKDIIGLEVKIFNPSDINLLKEVLINYSVSNFTTTVGDYIPNSSKEVHESTIYKRTIVGKEITATQNELELSLRFIDWIKSIGASYISPEQYCNEYDRIDVAFKLNNEKIISELKSLSSYNYSTKRAIRAALGQLLDYQYFDKNNKKFKLWIVIDGSISQKEKLFISRINTNHNLSISVIYETSKNKFIKFP